MPLESSATVRCRPRHPWPAPDRSSSRCIALDHFGAGVCTFHLLSASVVQSSSQGPVAGVRPVRAAPTNPHHPCNVLVHLNTLPACSRASCTVACLSDPRLAPTTERSTRSGRAHPLSPPSVRLWVHPQRQCPSGDASSPQGCPVAHSGLSGMEACIITVTQHASNGPPLPACTSPAACRSVPGRAARPGRKRVTRSSRTLAFSLAHSSL
jgi:hypothetical protein